MAETPELKVPHFFLDFLLLPPVLQQQLLFMNRYAALMFLCMFVTHTLPVSSNCLTNWHECLLIVQHEQKTFDDIVSQQQHNMHQKS
jgi:hypothetical protein